MERNGQRGHVSGAIVVLLFGLVMLGGTAIKACYNGYAVERDITGHLKRAADSNRVETAIRELDAGLAAMEARGFTSGNTSIMFDTPDNDMGFWHKNLVDARDALKATPANASELEKSNALIKLRETILDHTSDGDEVTRPSYLWANGAPGTYIILLILGGLLLAAGGVWFMAEIS